MKNYKKLASILLVSVAVLLLTAGTSNAQNASEQLFEKALYAEEMKGDLAEAIKIYQQVLKENPGDRQVSARTLLHIGMCYEKLGSEQARQAYQDVISKYSEQAKEVSMAKERITHLEAFTAELTREAEKHMKNGNELFKRWEYESAVKEYENAIKLRPNTSMALNAQYCIGQSWFRAGKYDSALATFTKLIEENPKSNIAPVSELMVDHVKNTMENEKSKEKQINSPDGNTIVDPETGISYTKIKTFTGKNDLISYTSGGFNISPNGRFMVLENKVVPVDGSDAFKLVEMEAMRAIYSPDMKKAAFFADSAIWEVPVSPLTGQSVGQPRKLVSGRYRFQYPVSWSPNGEKLVFERVDKTITGDLWTVSVLDGKIMPVTNSPEFENSPAWSPDGKSIVFKKERNLWLTSIGGNETKMIIENGGFPQWSTDSKWLYHSNWENSYLYSLENNKNFKFKFPKQVGSFGSFSPDGKRMMFYRSSSDDKWGLKVVSTSGGPSFSPALGCAVYDSQWSSDGRLILAQSENEQGNVVYKIIPLTGENPVNVGIEVNVNGKPLPFTASKDLTKLAISVTREDRKKDLYIVPFSISEGRTIGPAYSVFEGWSGGAFNVTISWSPDGTKLAVVHDEDIWIYPLNEEKPFKITNTSEEERWVEWSPDGTMISYLVPFKQSGILHVIPATGGVSRVIHNDCEGATWSPDSKNISILSGDELEIISLTGKKIKTVANKKDLGLDDYSTPHYGPDGKKLAFIGSYNDKFIIFVYSIDNGKIIRLADEYADDFKYSLRWSPDGKWLSYLTEEIIKVRPEGSMWEADFEEIKEKLAKE